MSNDTKFTKGEWVVNKAFASKPTWHICKKTDVPAGVIASVYNEEAAKLIASAPELLEALQKAYDYIGEAKDIAGTHVRAKCIAAIKKATT